jgi:hypothetical protein
VTVGGTTLSLPATGGAVVINGVLTTPATAPTPAAIIPLGFTTLTGNPASQFVIGSQTLSPGGPAVTISGTTLSLPATGGGVIINGVLTYPTAAAAALAENSLSQIVIGGSVTLTPGGPAVTVGGTTYSQASSGNVVIVNGTPTTVPVIPSLTGGSSRTSQRPAYQTANSGSMPTLGLEAFLAVFALGVGGLAIGL